MRQYEYNCEFAPTNITLESTKRKSCKDHKTYTKQWRRLVAKVKPLMTEEEIVRTFIKVHDPPYFEEIFRTIRCSFAAIVNKLEEYDEYVRTGKIANISALKSQLDALQGHNKMEKNLNSRRMKEKMLLSGTKTCLLYPDFSGTLYIHHPTHITQTHTLFM